MDDYATRVTGSIKSSVTSASLSARASCIDSAPTGLLNGRITTSKGKGTKNYVIKAGSPTSLQSNADTKNTQMFWEGTVQVQVGKTKLKGYSAQLSAQKFKAGRWLGQFIIYNSAGSTYLTVYGRFSGNVGVDETLSCTAE